jgi:hypothetical protein
MLFLNPTRIIMDDPPVQAYMEGGVLYVQGDPWTPEECEDAGFVIEDADTEAEVAEMHSAGYRITRKV